MISRPLASNQGDDLPLPGRGCVERPKEDVSSVCRPGNGSPPVSRLPGGDVAGALTPTRSKASTGVGNPFTGTGPSGVT